MTHCLQRITAMGMVALSLMICTCHAADEEKNDKEEMTKEDLFSKGGIARISRAYGHLIYKSLDNPILKLDVDEVIQGMQDARAGKSSPMTEQEYEEAIASAQEISLKEIADKNLKDAEEFLSKNAREPGVIELEKEKLQALVLKEGDGDTVTAGMLAVMHYKGEYLDGTVFGTSQGGEPASINLNQTIPGFRQGVLGMKVGEKRRLFIHPDLGYGTSGQLLPNALLIFELEVERLEPLPEISSAEASENEEDLLAQADDDDDEDEDLLDDAETA